MLGVNLDMADIQYLENEVDRLNRYGIPNASRDALTSVAFGALDDSRGSLVKANGPNFTLRNTFTERSIMAERATGRRIDDMQSEMGSIQEYMKEQEEGFTKRTKGRFGLAIPTPATADQTGGIRTKPMRRRNWLSSVNPVRAYGWNIMGPNNKGRHGAVAAMYFAIANGSRVVFIDSRRDHFHRKTGFYRVIGGTKKDPEGAKLKLLYLTSRKIVRVTAHSWMKKPADKNAAKIGEFYRKALMKWIERGSRR